MPDNANRPRIEYNAPTLRVYGDAKKLTEAVGTTGATDGGSKAGMTKTA